MKKLERGGMKRLLKVITSICILVLPYYVGKLWEMYDPDIYISTNNPIISYWVVGLFVLITIAFFGFIIYMLGRYILFGNIKP